MREASSAILLERARDQGQRTGVSMLRTSAARRASTPPTAWKLDVAAPIAFSDGLERRPPRARPVTTEQPRERPESAHYYGQTADWLSLRPLAAVNNRSRLLGPIVEWLGWCLIL